MYASERTRRRRRPTMWAAVLFACALGSLPAAAQLPDGPVVTVPTLPITDGEDGSTPVPPTTPPTTAPEPTTPPPPTTSPEETTPAVTPDRPSAPAASSSTSSATEPSRSSATKRARRTAPATESVATVHVAPAAEQGPTLTRLRQLTLPTARQFGFPLGLALLVLAFVAFQGRLDARDPKLAFAPVSVDDDLLPFT